MEALVDYIKPELLITAIALYFMGIALKECWRLKRGCEKPMMKATRTKPIKTEPIAVKAIVTFE